MGKKNRKKRAPASGDVATNRRARQKFELIEKFEAGFAAGARAVNPDIVIIPQYITMAPDFDGFFAADRAQEIALQNRLPCIYLVESGGGG